MTEDTKSGNRRGGPSTWRKAAPFAIMSFVSFLVATGLLCLMLWKAELLVKLGFVGNLYYIVLLPLGLSVAAFLFGVLRSYAKYSGMQTGGQLELSGPIVGFALVVVGGFYLPQHPPEAFSVTVLVHGEAGPHDLLLRNSGEVWVTLGADLRHEEIADKGQADFKNIPASFRGQSVAISVQADGFELSDPDRKYLLDGDRLELTIRRKAIRLSGSVLDTEGRPITNATVQVRETKVSVDNTGHFALMLNGTDDSTGIPGEVMAPRRRSMTG